MSEEKIKISVNQEDVQNIINCYEKDIKYIKELEDRINKACELVKEIKLHYQNHPTMIPDVKINKLEDLLKGDKR